MDHFRSPIRISGILFTLLSVGSTASAQVSGTWTGTAASRSTSAGLVTITATASGPVALGSSTLGCAGAYSTSAVDLAPSLLVNYTDFTQTGMLVFTFSQPVRDPILHLDRIGGNQLLLATSAMLTVQTPSITWTGIAANGTHFDVASPTTIYRTPGLLCASGQECGPALGALLGGPASGSLRINGLISSLTLSCTQAPGIPLGNPGDVFEIAFSAVLQPPVAGNDAFALNEDATFSGSVAGNDTDADNTPAQLVWSLDDGGSAEANGVLTLDADGTFSFTPDPNVSGTFSFTYSVCDPDGACDQATATLNVTAVNDQPVAGDDAFTMNEDAVLNAAVDGNDSDLETPHASLVYSVVNAGTAGANGTLVLQPNGSFTYTPNADVTGTFSFIYRACDAGSACDQAVVTIVVEPLNDPPTAITDVYTMDEDAVLTNDVGANDTDVDDAPAALVFSLVDGGTAVDNGSLTFNADGTFTYAPSLDFTGDVHFTYTVCDAAGVCADANVVVLIQPVNDAAFANDDLFAVDEDGVLNASVTANDGDVDDPWSLSWTLVNGGTAAANGTLVFDTDGDFSYAPTADFNGAVTFTYRACDGLPACDLATVTINVAPIDDAPVANDDAFAILEDVPLIATVASNDVDIDDAPAQLTWTLVSGGTAAINGALVLAPDGSFTFTPTLDLTGTVSFTYRLCDPFMLCDGAMATIVIGGTNDAPVTMDDTFNMVEDGSLSNTVSTNDSDPDADPLTFALVSGGSAAANGTLSFNANGSFQFTPSADRNGTFSFSYQACDPSLVCDVALVTIVVGPVNDPPVANDDAFVMTEDGSLSVGVLGNDNDVDALPGTLTWNLVDGGTAAANGDLLFLPAGTFTYIPSMDLNGNVWFTYALCDAEGLCDQATVSITIVSLNDPPIAQDDAFDMNEDASLAASVSGNDGDVDHTPVQCDRILINGGTAAANGTLAFHPDGSFDYTPAPDVNGVFSFTYRLCDPSAACDDATVTITVAPVNDAPVAMDDAFVMDEDGALGTSVAGNDSDVDGDALVFSLQDAGTAGSNGTLLFSTNGTFTYTPNADVHATVTFTYAACDASVACDDATVTIVVSPVNDLPVAVDDAFVMLEDGVLDESVSPNDQDVDGDIMDWTLIAGGSAAANGTLLFRPDGTFTYGPYPGFNGSVAFTYAVCDPNAACDPADVTILVSPVNDAPVAGDDAFTMLEDGVLSNTVNSNDADPDNTSLQLTWSLVDGSIASGNGLLGFNSDGSFTYMPVMDFHGVVSFIYQVCDLDGLCDQAVVTITVDPVNDVPVAEDDAFDMNEDAALSASVAGNDNDVDGDALTWALVNGGSAEANGMLEFNEDGTFTYTPAADLNGTVAFTYETCDANPSCDLAVVTIIVHPVNDAPVANDDAFDLNEDAALSASVSGNDSDVDGDALTWALVNGGSAEANGMLEFNDDGTFTYTPEADLNGTVSFTYEACDASPICDLAVVTIIVHPVNDAPVAEDDAFDMNEDAALSASVAGNDNDVDGDALTWALVNGGSATANGMLEFNEGGTFTYTPEADLNGTISFTYQACDAGSACDPGIVTIIVHPVNDAPVAEDDAFDMNEDDVLHTSVAGNDSDIDGDALTWALVNGGSATANGMLEFNEDGTFTYTPEADLNGTVSFTYQACDASSACDPATVTIIVHPVNDAPVAEDDAFDMNEDAALSASVTGNDSDVDGGALTWNLVDGGTAASNGVLILNSDGTFSYMPTIDFSGTVSFTYQACDASSVCDPATVTIVVHPVNDAPIAEDDEFDLNEDAVLNASVTGNDNDVDGDALTWSLVDGGTATANGMLEFNEDGTFTYTPEADLNGTVSFTYQACDASSACDPATVTIIVHPVNDVPVAEDDAFDMNEDAALNASVTGNDNDVDSDPLTWTLIDGGTAAANGLLGFNSDGSFDYTPAMDFHGVVSFIYQVCDLDGLCDQAVVTITVDPINDVPVAEDDAFDMNEDAVLNASVTGNDNDVDGDALTWALVNGGSATANGMLEFNEDGTFTYTPEADLNGTVNFTYETCDANPSCDLAVVTIIVHPVNDAPVANDDAFDMNEDGVLHASVVGNDSDVDGDALTWALVNGGSAAANGMLEFNEDGTFTYTPAADLNGTVSFTYQACDAGSACDAAIVTIIVHPVNDAPVAEDDAFDLNEDAALSASVAGNDSDVDGDAMTWAMVDSGTATANGVLDFNDDGTFTYTPATDLNGTVSFTYQACDASSACDPATVTIIVHPVNDAPVAMDDVAATDQNVSTSIDVLLNDSDPDGDVLSLGSASALHGSVTINGDGSIAYVPLPDWCGIDTIAYTACDPGPLCDQALVVVDVLCISSGNGPPVALDDSVITVVNLPIYVDVLGNDSDPENEGLLVGSAVALHGSVVINADQTLLYIPLLDWVGTDTVAYTACDPGPLCDGALVKVRVDGSMPTDHPPVAVDDSTSTAPGVPVEIDVVANDTDEEGNGLKVVEAQAFHGAVIILSDHVLRYVPGPDPCTTDTIRYNVCDPDPLCDEGMVKVTIMCEEPVIVEPLPWSIPQGFSPNGDGIGDTWVITGMERYPKASVSVVDRWGQRVLEASPYVPWDGQGPRGALPAATYWYVIDLHADGHAPLTGYLYLNR